MAAVASFHTEKCRHLVSAHEASARRLCSMFGSIFVLVYVYSRPTCVKSTVNVLQSCLVNTRKYDQYATMAYDHQQRYQ